MAIIFLESFDHYDREQYGGLYYKYNPDAVSNAGICQQNSSGVLVGYGFDFWCNVYANDGRRSTRAFGASTIYSRTIVVRPKGGMSETTLTVGFAIRFPSTVGVTLDTEWYQLCAFFEGANYAHCSIRLHGDGTIRVYNGTSDTGATWLATSAPTTWLGGQYYYVEVQVTLHNSAGTVEVRRDEVTIAYFDGLDTINDSGASGVCDRVVLANARTISYTGGVFNTTVRTVIDDVYITDTSGSVNTGFLGSIRVDCKFATTDGAHRDWSPSTGTDHYACVDDPLVNDTDYVSSATVGHQDTYVFGDLTHTPTSILAVQTTHYSRRSDTNLREVRTIMRTEGSPGTDHYMSDAQALTDVWALHAAIAEVNPATSAAWTKDEINAAEFGIEVVT